LALLLAGLLPLAGRFLPGLTLQQSAITAFLVLFTGQIGQE
jgi:hypothetical protein